MHDNLRTVREAGESSHKVDNLYKETIGVTLMSFCLTDK